MKLMEQMAEKTNRELAAYLPEKLRDENLLNADGSISLHKVFTRTREHVGPYSKEDLKNSRREVRQRQIEWIKPNISSVRAYYQEKFGAETEKDIIAAWEEEKNKHDGTLAEMAITGVLHRFLKKQFIVMRASRYDDYMNGVDNVIVDKESGTVVCAFDEVAGSERNPQDQELFEKKLGNIREKSQKTGTTIKYGISLEKDPSGAMRLVGKEFGNVPTFCLRISKEELHRLLDSMSDDIDAGAGEDETKIFESLIASMHAQSESMMGNGKLLPEVKENLIRFRSFLKSIESV